MLEKKLLQPITNPFENHGKVNAGDSIEKESTTLEAKPILFSPTPPSGIPCSASNGNLSGRGSTYKLPNGKQQLPKLDPRPPSTTHGSPFAHVDANATTSPTGAIPTSPSSNTIASVPSTVTAPSKKSFLSSFKMPLSSSSSALSSATVEFGGTKQRKSKAKMDANNRGTKSHNILPLGLGSDEQLDKPQETSPPQSGSMLTYTEDPSTASATNPSTATANASSISRPNTAIKTKSLPKISAIFKKSPPNPVGVSSSTNALANPKNRSISASPNAAQSAITSSMAGLSIATPLSQASKVACLSAYEMHTPATSKAYTLDDFMIVKRVGKGGFASVYLVRLKASTGRYWALKVVKKADVVRLKQEKQILNEKNILKNIQHAFIVELLQTFQDPQHLYMVMEYVAGGDLFTYLRKVQRFSEDDARFYVSEVLVSLEYLHAHDIVYRDLKPENILLDTTGHIKLADFGFAKIVKNTTCSFCGTPDYIAAEIVIGKPYTKSVDWWSLGVLIFELTSGKTPFGDESSERVYENIQVGKVKWNSLLKGTVKEIISQLLVINVNDRLGSGSAGAAAIKAHPYFAKINWGKLEARQVTPPYTPNCIAPEIIEKERAQKLVKDEVLENIQKANTATHSHSSWLGSGGYGDLFKNF